MSILYALSFFALFGLAEFSSSKTASDQATATFETTAALDDNIAHVYFNRHLPATDGHFYLDEPLAQYYITDQKNLREFTKFHDTLRSSSKMKSRSAESKTSPVPSRSLPPRHASMKEPASDICFDIFKEMEVTRNKKIFMSRINPPSPESRSDFDGMPGWHGLKRLRTEVQSVVEQEMEKFSLEDKAEKEVFEVYSTTKKEPVQMTLGEAIMEVLEKTDKCKTVENDIKNVTPPTKNVDEMRFFASSSKNKAGENAVLAAANEETNAAGPSTSQVHVPVGRFERELPPGHFVGECSKGTSSNEDMYITYLREWGIEVAYHEVFPTSISMFAVPRNLLCINSLNPALSFKELSKYCDLSPPHPGTIFDYKYIERLKIIYQLYDDELSTKLTPTMKKALRTRKKKICGSKGTTFANSLCEVIRERYGWQPQPGSKVHCVQARVNGYENKVNAALCHFEWPKSSYKGNKRILTSPITGRIFNSDKGCPFNLVTPHDHSHDFTIALLDSVREYEYYIAKLENDDGHIQNIRQLYTISTVNFVIYDGTKMAEFMDNDLTKIIAMLCRRDEEQEYLNALSMTTGYSLQKTIQILTDIAIYEYHLHFVMAPPDEYDRMEKKIRKKMEKSFASNFIDRIRAQKDKPLACARFY